MSNRWLPQLWLRDTFTVRENLSIATITSEYCLENGEKPGTSAFGFNIQLRSFLWLSPLFAPVFAPHKRTFPFPYVDPSDDSRVSPVSPTSGFERRQSALRVLWPPPTGYIEGFFRAENCNKNMMKSINTISLFCILKSIIKFNLFLLCQSWSLEKIEFNYTF